MEVSLPPLFAIQSHSLSQNILLLSNPAVSARQTAEVTLSPLLSLSHFLSLL